MTAVAPILDEWIERNNTLVDRQGNASGGLKILSELSGVPERRIYAIRRGFLTDGHKRPSGRQMVYTTLTFDTVDRLLVGMGWQHEWHVRLKKYWDMPIPPNQREKHLLQEAA